MERSEAHRINSAPRGGLDREQYVRGIARARDEGQILLEVEAELLLLEMVAFGSYIHLWVLPEYATDLRDDYMERRLDRTIEKLRATVLDVMEAEEEQLDLHIRFEPWAESRMHFRRPGEPQEPMRACNCRQCQARRAPARRRRGPEPMSGPLSESRFTGGSRPQTAAWRTWKSSFHAC